MRVLICAPTAREYRAMRYALDRAQSLRNSYDLVEVGIGKALSSAGVSRALTLAECKYDMLAVKSVRIYSAMAAFVVSMA